VVKRKKATEYHVECLVRHRKQPSGYRSGGTWTLVRSHRSLESAGRHVERLMKQAAKSHHPDLQNLRIVWVRSVEIRRERSW
jgi:hypothetical protein